MVNDILKTVSFTLSDKANVTYPEPDLIAAINNGCRMVVIYRPDARSKVATIPLVKGVKQTLPDDALRLLDTYYNENGYPIQMVNRKDVDRSLPNWVNMEPADEVLELMYDERVPDTFYVYPPVEDGVRINVAYSIMPEIIASKDDKFPLPEKYVPPVIEWTLYQMFSLDTKNMQAQQQAMMHSQQFYQMLQVKMQGDLMVAPDTSKASSSEQ